MALQITFRDRFDVDHSVAHGEVMRIELDRTNKRATVVVDLFNDLTAAQKGADPFDKTEFIAENLDGDSQFDDFFDDAVLAAGGVSPLTQAEDFLIAKIARFSGAAKV